MRERAEQLARLAWARACAEATHARLVQWDGAGAVPESVHLMVGELVAVVQGLDPVPPSEPPKKPKRRR